MILWFLSVLICFNVHFAYISTLLRCHSRDVHAHHSRCDRVLYNGSFQRSNGFPQRHQERSFARKYFGGLHTRSRLGVSKFGWWIRHNAVAVDRFQFANRSGGRVESILRARTQPILAELRRRSLAIARFGHSQKKPLPCESAHLRCIPSADVLVYWDALAWVSDEQRNF